MKNRKLKPPYKIQLKNKWRKITYRNYTKELNLKFDLKK